MRIVIAKTAASGGGLDHLNTDRDGQGRAIDSWNEESYGFTVEFSDGESRLYPWSSIMFVDYFDTP